MIETIESPYIHECVSEDFESLVLNNSDQGPVLVNFWSRKAGPCLRQHPILDKLIHDYNDRILLINIDIDHEFIVTKKYGISSVPTLKLFRYKKVAVTLHGFQSENDLKKVLDNYVARDSDSDLAKTIKIYTEGNHNDAYLMITDAIVADPVNPRLPLAMCKLLKHEQRYDEAIKIINSLPESLREKNDITLFYYHLLFCIDVGEFKDVESVIAQLEQATNKLEITQQLVAVHVLNENYEAALQALVAIIEQDKFYNDSYAQKAMLRIFSIVGSENPLTALYKKNLRHYAH